jgi:hypothetical protein
MKKAPHQGLFLCLSKKYFRISNWCIQFTQKQETGLDLDQIRLL